MDDCVKKYHARRDARLEARKSGCDRNDYGVKGMKWGEHNAEEEPANTGGRNAKAQDALKDGNTVDAAIRVSEMTRDMKEGEAVTFTDRKTGKEMRLERNGLRGLSFTNTLGKNQHFSQQQAESLLRDAIFYGKSKVKFE